MIKYQKTKTINCKDNNKSSDAVSGNFILGCEDEHHSYCNYCYVKRFNRKYVYVNTNTDDILNACDEWVKNKPLIKTPNQVHQSLYLIDISCDTDISRYWYEYNWIKVFDYFKNHQRLGATFATKWVNKKLLDYEPNKKIRVRISLLPEQIKSLVERKTSPILNRIKFLNDLVKHDYEAHINLSPIIYYKDWLKDYESLFQQITDLTNNETKEQLYSECIFLTHNENLHKLNLSKNIDDSLLWNPEIQESKFSQYGGENVRYEHNLKFDLIEQFKQLYSKYFDLQTIRYIF